MTEDPKYARLRSVMEETAKLWKERGISLAGTAKADDDLFTQGEAFAMRRCADGLTHMLKMCDAEERETS